MSAFLHARYREAQREFLDQVAYAARKVEEFAEERGGFDALLEADRRSYQGRKRRLIAMAYFNDAAEELIEALATRIDELIDEKRRLSADLTQASGKPGRKQFADEADKEYYRAQSLEFAMRSQPHLY
ncbi:MAG TPA: hypothetical protein PLM33_10685 [Acidobacteriota bacterium]|nr:hypothetical protein [Acidobacteriota bacterium]